MAISTPALEVSDEINRISAQIEKIDRTLRSHLYALNTEKTEEARIIQDVALERFEVLKELPETGPRMAKMLFTERLALLRERHIAHYISLLKSHDQIVVEGEVENLSGHRDEFLHTFVTRIDEALAPFFKKDFRHSERSIRHEIRRLKEKIAEKRLVINQIFEERIQQLADTNLSDKSFQQLLQERQNLLQAREITDRYVAAQVGNIDYIARSLTKLFKSRELNKRDSRGFTVLHIATFCNQVPTVKFLLSSGASVAYVDQENKYATIHWAAWIGNVQILKLLCEHGAQVDARGDLGRTPLHIAAFKHNIYAAEYLLHQGANVNAQTDEEAGRETPLHQAITNNDEEMAALLCRSPHLDPNLKTERGYTPLYYATDLNLPNMMRLIVQHLNFVPPLDHSDPCSLHALIEKAQSTEAKRILEKKLYGRTKTPKETLRSNSVYDASRTGKTRTQIHAENGTYVLLNPITDEEVAAFCKQEQSQEPSGFGRNCLARRKESGEFVVVTKIEDPEMIEQAQAAAELEKELLGKPNLRPILDSVLSRGASGKQKLYQFRSITGYAEGNAFAELLQKCENTELKNRILTSLAIDLLTGLEAMHQEHLYHFCFNIQSIAIHNSGEANVCGFRSTSKLTDGQIVREALPKVRILSPERITAHQLLLRGAEFTPLNAALIDAWGIGETLLELFRSKSAFSSSPEKRAEQIDEHTQQRVTAILKEAPDHLKETIQGLLQPDPKKRLSISQALDLLSQHTPFSTDEERYIAFQELKGKEEDPEELERLVGLARQIEEAIDAGRIPEARNNSQLLFSEGKLHIARVVLEDKHANPLPIALSLVQSLVNSKIQFEDELRTELARSARLFTELTAFKCSQEKRKLYPEDIESLRNTLSNLYDALKEDKNLQRLDNQLVLQFNVVCCLEAIKSMDTFDYSGLFDDLISLIIDSDFNAAFERIKILQGQLGKSWFADLLYLSWLGCISTQDMKTFENLRADITKQARKKSKIALGSVDIYFEHVRKGTQEIKEQALQELISLSRMKGKKHTPFWKVRYRAIQHLYILSKDFDLSSTLSELRENEKNKHIQRLFTQVDQDPHIVEKWNTYGNR